MSDFESYKYPIPTVNVFTFYYVYKTILFKIFHLSTISNTQIILSLKAIA